MGEIVGELVVDRSDNLVTGERLTRVRDAEFTAVWLDLPSQVDADGDMLRALFVAAKSEHAHGAA